MRAFFNTGLAMGVPMLAVTMLLLTVSSAASLGSQEFPPCGVELVVEDFEDCPVGTGIANCNGWLTYANGSNAGDFYITDQEYVSGNQALHVAGAGSCWEGAAYKPLTLHHVLLLAMIKASGNGPNGCHHRQNGIELNYAGWSFEMAGGAYPEGLNCYVIGDHYTAIPGFQNAAGQWYAVAIELDYDTGIGNFWLDGQLVWTTPIDTDYVADRVWMRSGEGEGWFDDVTVCEVEDTPAHHATWSMSKRLYR